MNNKTHPPIWLALRFFQLPIDLYWSAREQQQKTDQENEEANKNSQALVVAEQQVVIHCNQTAREQGVEEGVDMSTAYALCGDLTVIAKQPDREQLAIEQLAQWFYRWTPDVVLWSADTILLEISRCLTLFHGLLPILKGIKKEVTLQGYHYRAGIAHTPKAAWLLSHESRKKNLSCFDFVRNQLLKPEVMGLIKNTPIRRLSVTEEAFHEKLLRDCDNMGLRKIGDLISLPAADLKKRLGSEPVKALEKLTGRRPDPQTKVQPEAHFEKTLFFIEGLTSTQMISFPMKRLLGEFSSYLSSRQLHCQSFEWQFDHHYQEKSYLSVDLSQAKNNTEDFFALTQLKLERFSVVSPIESITLRSRSMQLASQKALSWLDNVKEQDQDISSLVDKLKHRLGAYAVKTLREQKEHWPELSVHEEAGNHYLIEGTVEEKAVARNDRYQVAEPVRPFCLLRRPVELVQRDQQLFYQGKALTVEPYVERIEYFRMLQHKSRDYYLGSQEDGTQYWIFYSPLTCKWYLHGVFS